MGSLKVLGNGRTVNKIFQTTPVEEVKTSTGVTPTTTSGLLPGAVSATTPTQTSGKTFLQKLGEILTYGQTMDQASSAMAMGALFGNKELESAGKQLGQSATENYVDSAKEFQYIAERGASGTAKGVEGFVNALGYVGQTLNQQQLQQNAESVAAIGALTGNQDFRGAAQHMTNYAQEVKDKGLQATVSFGSKYQQNVQEKYADADITKAGQAVGNVSEVLGGLLPSAASNVVLPGSGLVVSALSAGGNAAQEAKASGASDAQALAYGTVVGGIEAATEKIFDGVAGIFGKGAADDVIKNVAKRLAKNETAQNAFVKIANSLGEGFEEFISEFGQRIASGLIVGTDTRTLRETTSDAFTNAIMGAIVGGVVQTAGSVIQGSKGTPSQLAQQAASVAVEQIKAETAATPEIRPATATNGTLPTLNAQQGFTLPTGENGQNKTAPVGTGTEYRAEVPQNVEYPTVPIINLSMQDVADLNGGVMPQTGNYVRKAATEQTEKRLGLDKNPAIYIEASNVTRNGDSYVIKITKPSLKKMLSASSYASGVVPLESVAVLNQIERIAQNGVYFKSEGDRYGRSQIAGYDHLMTTVYIDNVPYIVDMRVRVSDQKADNGNTLYHFTPEAIEITKKNDSDISTTGRHAPSIKSETPLSSDTTVPQTVPGVNSQYTQESGAVSVPEGETESVGAAPSGFDPYSNMIGKYGIIPEGETPARMVDLPKSTNGKDKVSLTARTAMEAQATPDEMVGELGSAVLDGDLSYIPINNKQAETMAKASIKNAGDFSTALANWTAEVRQGKSSAKLTAMGALLYNEAANSGNTKQAMSILADYAAMVRHGAQAVQAARILKTLSPENKLLFIQQTVNKMNEANQEKSGRKIKPEDNVPVEEWMKRVGEDLAKGLASKAKVSQGTAKTVSREILNDLKNYANTVIKKSKSLKSKTAEAKFFDLLNNWPQYSEAIDSARSTLQQKFAGNPDALVVFNEWLNSSANSMLVSATGAEGDIVVDEAIIDEYLKAKTDEARDAALDKIYQNIADQVPSSLSDKFTALRYLNMLGNLRTQMRNVGGNIVNMGVRSVDHHVQALLQNIVHRNDPTQRTTTFFKDSELAQLAKSDFDSYRSVVMGEQKYSPTAAADNNLAKEIDDRRTIFKNNGTWGTEEAEGFKGLLPVRAVRKGTDLLYKVLDIYQTATNWAMDKGDEVFAKHAYSDAMSRYLKAKGYTAEQWRAGEIPSGVLDEARAHSIQEAQEATFRDSNAFSDTIAKIGFKNPQNIVEKGVNVAVKGVLPFRKTPANVAVQAEKHSPLGLINTAVKAVQAASPNSEVTGNDVIKSLSETLTGSGLLVLGFALAAGGLATGGKDDNEELAQIDDLQGFQEYAINVPGVGSYTYDSFTPAAMSFAMGVVLQNAIERNGGVNLDAVIDAIGGMSEVALNMSMLQGLNDVFEEVSYSDSPLIDAALNAAVGYFTQGLTSTLFGQIERTSENERMTTFRDSSGVLPTGTQYDIGKISQKLPGLDYNQIPYIDAWGRTEESGALPWRAVENFLSPGYTSKEVTNAAEEEIRRLAEEGYTGVAPDVVKHSQQISYKENPKDEKSQKRYMNADEYVEYATIKGETSLSVVSEMIESDFYKSLTDEEKASVIGLAYTYAGHLAADEITDGKHEMDKKYILAQTAQEDLGLSEADYLILSEKYGGTVLNDDKIREAYDKGVDPVDFLDYNAGIKKYDSNDNGSYTIAERAQSIENSGMSEADQLTMWELYQPKWKEKADENGIAWETFVDYKLLTNGLESDKDKNGKTISGSLKKKKIAALQAAGYSYNEALNLYSIIK